MSYDDEMPVNEELNDFLKTFKDYTTLFKFPEGQLMVETRAALEAAVRRFHEFCESAEREQSSGKVRSAQLQRLIFVIQAELAAVLFSGLDRAHYPTQLKEFRMDHGFSVANSVLTKRLDVVKRLARADKHSPESVPEEALASYWDIAVKLHPIEAV